MQFEQGVTQSLTAELPNLPRPYVGNVNALCKTRSENNGMGVHSFYFS
jgi:hypothetical protein